MQRRALRSAAQGLPPSNNNAPLISGHMFFPTANKTLRPSPPPETPTTSPPTTRPRREHVHKHAYIRACVFFQLILIIPYCIYICYDDAAAIFNNITPSHYCTAALLHRTGWCFSIRPTLYIINASSNQPLPSRMRVCIFTRCYRYIIIYYYRYRPMFVERVRSNGATDTGD